MRTASCWKRLRCYETSNFRCLQVRRKDLLHHSTTRRKLNSIFYRKTFRRPVWLNTWQSEGTLFSTSTKQVYARCTWDFQTLFQVSAVSSSYIVQVWKDHSHSIKARRCRPFARCSIREKPDATLKAALHCSSKATELKKINEDTLPMYQRKNWNPEMRTAK